MTQDEIKAVLGATWPAAEVWDLGPFRLREGAGGGKRVSAATVEDDWDFEALIEAEMAMSEPLFAIWPGDELLDQALAFKGYHLVDPVVVYHADVEQILSCRPEGDLAPETAIAHWPALAICEQIWAEAGIGASRLAVMDRVVGPKTVILSRLGQERSAGVAFVAIHDGHAMLHALDVRPAMRGQGVGHVILTKAAAWAKENGASTLSLVVHERNQAARRLYERATMVVLSQYHYRSAVV